MTNLFSHVAIRNMLLAAAIGCFAGSWFLIYASWPTPEPGLWTKEATIHLGEVQQQQQVTAKFDLLNNYAQELEIIDAVKGCSCTGATFTKMRLAPGVATLLSVVWKTGQTRGRSAVGVTVVYKLKDGAEFHKMLGVDANVVPDIDFDPEKLSFDGGRLETQSVRLTPCRMPQFTIKGVHCNHRAFKAQVSGQETVNVTFDGSTPVFANGIEPRLIIHTDSPNEPDLVVPLELRMTKPTQ